MGTTNMKRTLFFALFALTTACHREPPAAAALAPTPPLAQPKNPDFVGKIWISTTPGHALGTMLIFLPDRTLVMDSCHETYRLTQWGVAGEHIRWLEDTVPIEAAVEMPGKDALILRIRGIREAQSYVTASVPYVCPDMPK
jgi:hypothetical protein